MDPTAAGARRVRIPPRPDAGGPPPRNGGTPAHPGGTPARGETLPPYQTLPPLERVTVPPRPTVPPPPQQPQQPQTQPQQTQTHPTRPIRPQQPQPVDVPRPPITAAVAARAIGREARDLITLTGRLLGRYWLVLTGIAAVGATAAYWIQSLAVLVSRTSGVGGILVFALIPGAAFVTASAMLVLMGRLTDSTRRSAGAAMATFASALLLFLVLYEQNGQLTEDTRNYYYETTIEAIFAEEDWSARIPVTLSFSIAGIILTALVLRSIGASVLERWERREEAGELRAGRTVGIRTGVLRVLVSYSELVWVALSITFVVAVGRVLGGWWDSRVAVHAVSDAWASLRWPDVTGIFGWIGQAFGVIGSIVVAGIVVPTAWLALGTILYGTRRGATSVVALRAAETTASLGSRVKIPLAADQLTDVARLQRSWTSLVRPTSRWGPLGGAVGLVLVRGWLPVGVFCVLFTILAQADYAVWWLADLLLPTVAANDWRAVYPLVSVTGVIAVQVLTLALVAAGAEVTMRRLGMPSVLRLAQASKDQ